MVGHAQCGRLVGAAGVPGHQVGGNGGTVFDGTRQVFGVQSLVFIGLGVHLSGHDDGHVLVAQDQVGSDGGQHRGRNQEPVDWAFLRMTVTTTRSWLVFSMMPPNIMAQITRDTVYIIDSKPPLVSRLSTASTPELLV
jgi:hypothetical protein